MRPLRAALALRRCSGVPLRTSVFRPGVAARRTAAPLIGTNGCQNLFDTEIDLTTLEVDANDLNRNLVAKAVALPGVLTEQRVILLVEPVVIISHRRDVHEPLDIMFAELDEQPKWRDAGDVSVKDIPDLVRHETHFLPLDELAFRFVGAALHFGRMAADLRQVLVELLAALVGETRSAAVRAATGGPRGPDTGESAR